MQAHLKQPILIALQQASGYNACILDCLRGD